MKDALNGFVHDNAYVIWIYSAAVTGNLNRSVMHYKQWGEHPLKMYVFPSKSPVDWWESVQLVLQQIRIFWVKESSKSSLAFLQDGGMQKEADTLISFPPSVAILVLFPTISLGQTRSSNIFSWTAVRVRERGRFCLEDTEAFRLGLGRTRRWERKTTYLSDNFFSSSRVSLAEWRRVRAVIDTRTRRVIGKGRRQD